MITILRMEFRTKVVIRVDKFLVFKSNRIRLFVRLIRVRLCNGKEFHLLLPNNN